MEKSWDTQDFLRRSLFSPLTAERFVLGREGVEWLAVFVVLELQSVNPWLEFRQGKQRQFQKCKAFSVKIVSLSYLLKC